MYLQTGGGGKGIRPGQQQQQQQQQQHQNPQQLQQANVQHTTQQGQQQQQQHSHQNLQYANAQQQQPASTYSQQCHSQQQHQTSHSHPQPHQQTQQQSQQLSQQPIPYYAYQLTQVPQQQQPPTQQQPPPPPPHHHHPTGTLISNGGIPNSNAMVGANSTQSMGGTLQSSGGNIASGSATMLSHPSSNASSVTSLGMQQHHQQHLQQVGAVAAGGMQHYNGNPALMSTQLPPGAQFMASTYMQQFHPGSTVMAASNVPYSNNMAAAVNNMAAAANGNAVNAALYQAAQQQHQQHQHQMHHPPPQLPPAGYYHTSGTTPSQQQLHQMHPAAAHQLRSVLAVPSHPRQATPGTYMLTPNTVFALPPPPRPPLLPNPHQPASGGGATVMPVQPLMQPPPRNGAATSYLAPGFCQSALPMQPGMPPPPQAMLGASPSMGPSPLQNFAHYPAISASGSSSSLSGSNSNTSNENIKQRKHAIPIINPFTFEDVLNPSKKIAAGEAKPNNLTERPNEAATQATAADSSVAASAVEANATTTTVDVNAKQRSGDEPMSASDDAKKNTPRNSKEKIDQQMQTDKAYAAGKQKMSSAGATTTTAAAPLGGAAGEEIEQTKSASAKVLRNNNEYASNENKRSAPTQEQQREQREKEKDLSRDRKTQDKDELKFKNANSNAFAANSISSSQQHNVNKNESKQIHDKASTVFIAKTMPPTTPQQTKEDKPENMKFNQSVSANEDSQQQQQQQQQRTAGNKYSTMQKDHHHHNHQQQQQQQQHPRRVPTPPLVPGHVQIVKRQNSNANSTTNQNASNATNLSTTATSSGAGAAVAAGGSTMTTNSAAGTQQSGRTNKSPAMQATGNTNSNSAAAAVSSTRHNPFAIPELPPAAAKASQQLRAWNSSNPNNPNNNNNNNYGGAAGGMGSSRHSQRTTPATSATTSSAGSTPTHQLHHQNDKTGGPGGGGGNAANGNANNNNANKKNNVKKSKRSKQRKQQQQHQQQNQLPPPPPSSSINMRKDSIGNSYTQQQHNNNNNNNSNRNNNNTNNYNATNNATTDVNSSLVNTRQDKTAVSLPPTTTATAATAPPSTSTSTMAATGGVGATNAASSVGTYNNNNNNRQQYRQQQNNNNNNRHNNNNNNNRQQQNQQLPLAPIRILTKPDIKSDTRVEDKPTTPTSTPPSTPAPAAMKKPIATAKVTSSKASTSLPAAAVTNNNANEPILNSMERNNNNKSDDKNLKKASADQQAAASDEQKSEQKSQQQQQQPKKLDDRPNSNRGNSNRMEKSAIVTASVSDNSLTSSSIQNVDEEIVSSKPATIIRYTLAELKHMSKSKESRKPPLVPCQKGDCIHQLFVSRQHHHAHYMFHAQQGGGGQMQMQSHMQQQQYHNMNFGETIEFQGGGKQQRRHHNKKNHHDHHQTNSGGGGGSGGHGNSNNSGGGAGGSAHAAGSGCSINLGNAMGNNSGPAGNLQFQRKMDIIHVNLSLKEEIKLSECENAWMPQQLRKRSSSVTQDNNDDLEAVLKKVRGVLNKLTPDNFDVLLKTMTSISINTQEKMQQVMLLIFEKTVSEPNFAPTYAKFCKVLFHEIKLESKALFSNLLITRIQHEFETNVNDADAKKTKLQPLVDKLANCVDAKERQELQAELEDQEYQFRRRAWGTVRFIGEMYKLQSLTNDRVFLCIESLLEHGCEEKLEYMCKLLTTVGHLLEGTPEQLLNNARMDKIFRKIQDIVNKSRSSGSTNAKPNNQSNQKIKLSSRVRFMMQDVIDLRTRRWDQTTAQQAQQQQQNQMLQQQAQNERQQQQQQNQHQHHQHNHGHHSHHHHHHHHQHHQHHRRTTSASSSRQDDHHQHRNRGSRDNNDKNQGGSSGGYDKNQNRMGSYGNHGGGNSRQMRHSSQARDHGYFKQQKGNYQNNQQHQMQQHNQQDQSKVNIDVNKLNFSRNDEVAQGGTKLGNSSIYLWRTDNRQFSGSTAIAPSIDTTTTSSANTISNFASNPFSSLSNNSNQAQNSNNNANNHNNRRPKHQSLERPPPALSPPDLSSSSTSSITSPTSSICSDTTIMTENECQQVFNRLIEEVLDSSNWYDEALNIWRDFSFKQQVALVHYLLMNHLHLAHIKHLQRKACANIFAYLMRTNAFEKAVFTQAYKRFAEEFADLLVDVPNGWTYVFEFLGPILHERLLHFDDIWQPQWNEDTYFTERFLKAMILHFTSEFGANYVRDLWHKEYKLGRGQQFLSGAQEFREFLNSNNLQYIDRNYKTGQNEPKLMPPPGLGRHSQQHHCYNNTAEQIERIGFLLNCTSDCDLAIDFINTNVRVNLEFLRALTKFLCCDYATYLHKRAGNIGGSTAAAEHANRQLNVQVFRDKCMPLLRLCMDTNEAHELECLDEIMRSLTEVYDLAVANNLTCSIFEVLYDCEVISKDTFEKWYKRGVTSSGGGHVDFSDDLQEFLEKLL